jgi:hypothetical protein
MTVIYCLNQYAFSLTSLFILPIAWCWHVSSKGRANRRGDGKGGGKGEGKGVVKGDPKVLTEARAQTQTDWLGTSSLCGHLHIGIVYMFELIC